MPVTELRTIDPRSPDPALVREVAERLARGELVAFPTETVYGLGARGLAPRAVARIFAAKGRPSFNPLILHVLDGDAARALTSEWSEPAQRLAEQFWPGPLTIVLPKSAVVPDEVTGGGPTVALRAPTHPVARALIAALGEPIAAPSANLSTRVSSTRAEHVARQLDGRIELILDGGPTPGGLESTVVDLAAAAPRLLRPGPITAAQLSAALGQPIEMQSAAAHHASPQRSPGLMARHYAPQTPLELSSRAQARVAELLAAGERVGWLTTHEPAGHRNDNRVVLHQMPVDPDGYAAVLYAMLHELDVSGVTRIVVDQPPDEPAWAAIHDRLVRAAATD